MKENFDTAYKAFRDLVVGFASIMVEIAKMLLIYFTIPLWIIPYVIYKKSKGAGQ